MNSKSKISLADLLEVEREELENLREKCLEMFKARLSFFNLDAREIPDKPKGQQLYCNLIQKGQGGLEKCIKCEGKLCREAIQEKKPIVRPCFAKVANFAFPIELNNRVIGTCIGGQFLFKEGKNEERETIFEIARQLNLSNKQDSLWDKYNKLPRISKEELNDKIIPHYKFISEIITKISYRRYALKKIYDMEIETAPILTDERRIMERVVDLAIEVTNSDYGGIRIYNFKDHTLKYAYVNATLAGGLTLKELQEIDFMKVRSIARYLMEEGQYDTYYMYPGKDEDLMLTKTGYHVEKLFKDAQTGIDVLIILPGQKKKLGVLNVDSTRPESYTVDNIEVLRFIAQYASMAIETARLFKEFRSMSQISRNVLYHLGTEQTTILQNILDEVMNIGNTDRGTLWELDKENPRRLRRRITKGTEKLFAWEKEKLDKDLVRDFGQLLAGRAANEGKILISKNLQNDFPGEHFTGGMKSEVAMSVFSKKDGEKLLAVVTIKSIIENAFDGFDGLKLEALANQIGLAMEYLEQYKENMGLAAIGAVHIYSSAHHHETVQRGTSIAAWLSSVKFELNSVKDKIPSDVFLSLENNFSEIDGVLAELTKPYIPMEEEKEKIIIEEVIHGILEKNEEYLRSKDVLYDIEAEQDVGHEIEINPQWFAIVFEHLITNACRAMEDGGTLTIRLVEEGDKIKILVKDTGRGIPPDIKKILFEKRIHQGKGMGAGLLLARYILDWYEGTITLFDTGPEGTTFIIRFPALRIIL